MIVRPSSSYEAVIETGETGLAGTLGTRVNDNLGITTTAFDDTNVVEIADGVYAAHGRTAPDTAGQYTLIWTRGSGGEVLGTEDLTVTFTTPSGGAFYADVTELARILKIRNPSPEQEVAMERVLTAAAIEINHEIDLAEDTVLTAEQTSLAAEVNLERAVEHWRQQELPFGLVGIGVEVGPSGFAAKDTWERHAIKLRALKDQWGIA